MLLIGAWRWPHYEEAFSVGLRNAGVSVNSFKTSVFFGGFFGSKQMTIPIPGPALLALNNAIVSEAKRQRPDWLMFWRPTHILPTTIKKLQSIGIGTVSYNNDDPFGPEIHGQVPWHHHSLWYWYKKCLPWFDRNFFYRQINCHEALNHGARHAKVLMPYFMPWRDRPIALHEADKKRFESDISFVGHYEPDGREYDVLALLESGFRTRIWGGGKWNQSILGKRSDSLLPIIPAEGDDYPKAICGAKVCLAFLSRINRDTYTRRYFEIPACGRPMLARRTEDSMCMFKEDEEACFFSSTDELVDKAGWLLQNPQARERIADAGFRRVWADGHDVNSRVRTFLIELNI